MCISWVVFVLICVCGHVCHGSHMEERWVFTLIIYFIWVWGLFFSSTWPTLARQRVSKDFHLCWDYRHVLLFRASHAVCVLKFEFPWLCCKRLIHWATPPGQHSLFNYVLMLWCTKLCIYNKRHLIGYLKHFISTCWCLTSPNETTTNKNQKQTTTKQV